MRVGGGILALSAGGISVIMGFITLFVGAFGAAIEGEGADTVIGMGWAGVL